MANFRSETLNKMAQSMGANAGIDPNILAASRTPAMDRSFANAREYQQNVLDPISREAHSPDREPYAPEDLRYPFGSRGTPEDRDSLFQIAPSGQRIVDFADSIGGGFNQLMGDIQRGASRDRTPNMVADEPQTQSIGGGLRPPTQETRNQIQADRMDIETGQEGSPQWNFAQRRIFDSSPLSEEEISQAQTFAESIGSTFDPETGYSREAFEQSQQTSPQAQGGAQAGRPNIMGQEATQRAIQERFGLSGPSTLQQAITGNPDAVMDTDFQGRMRTFDSPDARAQNLAEGRAFVDEQSAARQARIGSRPDFNAPMERAPGTVTDRERRGTGEMSMEAATRMAGGDRIKARQMIEMQRQGRDPISGQPIRQEGFMSAKYAAETQKIQAETAKIISEIGEKSRNIDLSPAEKARDMEYGKELARWESSGRSNTQSNIDALDSITEKLSEGQIKTRGFIDSLPFASDWARAIMNPDAQDALDRVRGVVFQSLRETLGAQFTEREGQRFVEASYNPKLKPEQNAKRLADYAGRLKQAQAAKNTQLSYLRENGTLKGYTGPDPERTMLGMVSGGQSPISGDVDVASQADELLSQY